MYIIYFIKIETAFSMAKGKIKMATILVDYENVVGTNGLKGVDALQNDDVCIIFYSSCCGKYAMNICII